jgi:hypothetical protein
MHPAAYLGIGIRAAAPITRLVDDALYLLSRNKPKVDISKIHCIFIVCPPRSGGTLVYQALSRTLPGIYISNIHALFPKMGSRMLRNFNRGLSKNKFHNYYGYTSSLFDVYEGNELFEWAHRHSVKVPQKKLKDYYRYQFQNLVNNLNPRQNECVIFKNARSYFIAKDLHTAIPELKFIRVKRNRNQIIESVVRAYHDLGYFHPVPHNLKNSSIKDPVEFAVAQIDEIEFTIDQHFNSLPSSSQFIIEYERFCESASQYINAIAYDFLHLPGGSVIECPALSSLEISKRKKVTDNERLKINSLMNDS